jgi:hypothetical protein
MATATPFGSGERPAGAGGRAAAFSHNSILPIPVSMAATIAFSPSRRKRHCG